MSAARVLGEDFPALFASIPTPTTPVDAGGCAPPVHVETERQRDQRFIDEMRAANRAAADRRDPAIEAALQADEVYVLDRVKERA